MSTQTKTLAKSLHTITAIAKLAQWLAQSQGRPIDATSAQQFAQQAARIFGYADAADPYGLIDKAAKALAEGKVQ